ncbi:choice-of-anchor C domain-containing protein [Sphingomonas laterariae]|uniref:Choice-of-anchor C domain-containing protein n=1 Tax=Edaphosphingomonas laterariae TaxID=861865 RepID=A0A239HD03_9SPHN|nr:choice-of-anchor C family protein [Sphingomonas laterariae]SNS79267.1 choice-of-anchor C domain-containing protein [Sphingomonas laterariae]
MVRKLLLGVAAAVLMAGSANASLIVNGSFETGTTNPASGGFSTLASGDSTITGWTVSSGSVDWINGYWDAFDGTHSVDLAGSVPGAIEQTFATVAGQTYTVDYYLSGNPDGGDIAKQGLVAAINGATIFASDTILGIKAPAHDDMQYLKNTFQFTATGSSTTLQFSSNPTEGAYGAVLDMVTVNAVPEPTTWAMMLVGFGVVGASMRRRVAYRPAQVA